MLEQRGVDESQAGELCYPSGPSQRHACPGAAA
jgi:hypothetical protein